MTIYLKGGAKSIKKKGSSGKKKRSSSGKKKRSSSGKNTGSSTGKNTVYRWVCGFEPCKGRQILFNSNKSRIDHLVSRHGYKVCDLCGKLLKKTEFLSRHLPTFHFDTRYPLANGKFYDKHINIKKALQKWHIEYSQKILEEGNTYCDKLNLINGKDIDVTTGNIYGRIHEGKHANKPPSIYFYEDNECFSKIKNNIGSVMLLMPSNGIYLQMIENKDIIDSYMHITSKKIIEKIRNKSNDSSPFIWKLENMLTYNYESENGELKSLGTQISMHAWGGEYRLSSGSTTIESKYFLTIKTSDIWKQIKDMNTLIRKSGLSSNLKYLRGVVRIPKQIGGKIFWFNIKIVRPSM